MSELSVLQRRLLLAQWVVEQAAGWGSVTVLPTPVRYRLRPRLHDRKDASTNTGSATLEGLRDAATPTSAGNGRWASTRDRSPR